jgi:two-component system, cell cycle response regulator DivK
MPDVAKDRLTALVVDDFTDSRRMFRRMLEMRAFHVVEATNGREAVESAQRDCPDVVLMDLNMPHMDGLTATKLIRECRELCSRATIIAVTAFDTYGMREAAIEAGCNDYLVKPLDFSDLDKALRRVMPL